MSIRYATKAGNWSDVTVWDGGASLPGSSDDVYANNFAVTINQSISVNSLKTISNTTPAITAGGTFTVTVAATVTLAAGIQATDYGASSALLTVNASSNAVTITATANGFTAGTAASRSALSVSSGYTGTLTINGNVTGGTNGSAYGLNCAAACPINITGTVTGGTAGAGINDTANSTIFTISGDLIAGSSTTAYGLTSSGGTPISVTVSGDIKGGSVNASYGLQATAATVRGNLKPGSYNTGGVGTQAINSTNLLRFSGHIYSGNMYTSTGPSGFFPILGNWCAISGEEVYMHVFDDGNFPTGNNGTARVLVRYGPNNPAAADVRSGTTYGASGSLTGTLAVPPAASVASGVPVDATTGTAALKLSDVLSGTGAQVAAVFP